MILNGRNFTHISLIITFFSTFRYGTPGLVELQCGDAGDPDHGRAGGRERPARMQIPAKQGMTFNLITVINGYTIVEHGCQMAKFDPFLTWIAPGWRAWGRNPRKGRDQILQRSVAEP